MRLVIHANYEGSKISNARVSVEMVGYITCKRRGVFASSGKREDGLPMDSRVLHVLLSAHLVPLLPAPEVLELWHWELVFQASMVLHNPGLLGHALLLPTALDRCNLVAVGSVVVPQLDVPDEVHKRWLIC